MSDQPVLLDTCALLGLAGIQPITAAAVMRVESAGRGGAWVSPISAWEIATSCRFKPKPSYGPILGDPSGWFHRTLAKPPFTLVEFTPEMAFEAYRMPEPFHRDPGDRLLVATARALNCPILTSDAKILAYARSGHVAAIAC